MRFRFWAYKMVGWKDFLDFKIMGWGNGKIFGF